MNLERFYRECYLKTGGWIPLNPLTQDVVLGDFCQIQDGRLKSLGNILSIGLFECDILETELKLNDDNWMISSGVKQVYCSTEQVADRDKALEWTRLVLEFDDRGSFVFYGANPICRLIFNWSKLVEELTIRFTQSAFNFRHLYVITELVTVEDWALAIAGHQGASLEITSELRDTDYFRLLSHGSCRAEKSQGIDVFRRSNNQTATFFKAKKLVLTESVRELLLNQVVFDHLSLREQQKANWLDVDLLNLVESNELNISNCLSYFNWVDTGLEDAERLV